MIGTYNPEPPDEPTPPIGMRCEDCGNCVLSPDEHTEWAWCEYIDEFTLKSELVENLDCGWTVR